MSFEEQIRAWLLGDPQRMAALEAARALALPDWCLAAGFLRNLVWDKRYQLLGPTPLNDLDLLYFEPQDLSRCSEKAFERQLRQRIDLPWSVKNQARMHLRNGDAPYRSSSDAMAYWVEVETAVGAALTEADDILILAPFGLEALFAGTITLNPKRPKPDAFLERLARKGWQQRWPQLRIKGMEEQ